MSLTSCFSFLRLQVTLKGECKVGQDWSVKGKCFLKDTGTYAKLCCLGENLLSCTQLLLFIQRAKQANDTKAGLPTVRQVGMIMWRGRSSPHSVVMHTTESSLAESVNQPHYPLVTPLWRTGLWTGWPLSNPTQSYNLKIEEDLSLHVTSSVNMNFSPDKQHPKYLFTYHSQPGKGEPMEKHTQKKY